MELKFYRSSKDTEITRAIEVNSCGEKVSVYAIIVNACHAIDIGLVSCKSVMPRADVWLVISTIEDAMVIEFKSKQECKQYLLDCYYEAEE